MRINYKAVSLPVYQAIGTYLFILLHFSFLKLWERITPCFANSRALLAFISRGQILSLLFTVINAEINGTSCSIHCEKALSMLRYRLQ